MDNYQALQVGVYGGRGNVIPYGPGTPYATVNDLPDWVADAKLPILDKSTGIVSACCWVFHNEGKDYLDCGRPASLMELLAPTNAFTISSLFVANSVSTPGFIASIADSSSMQIGIGWVSTADILAKVGTNASSPYGLKISAGLIYKAMLISNGVSYYVNVNGESSAPTSSGSITATHNLLINGGRIDGSDSNPESDMAYMAFYNGAGVLVDCYDFTDPTKWSGGSTMVSCAGNTATFTDGTPTGIRKKAAIPRNLLVY